MIDLLDSNEYHTSNSAELQYTSKKLISLLKQFIMTKTFIFLLIWLFFLKICLTFKIAQIYLIISGIIIIFLNLGKRLPGTLSAYSIFNKNHEKILGTFSHEDVDNMLMNRNAQPKNRDSKENKKEEEEEAEIFEKIKKSYEKNLSKMGNQPCYCGSERKFKKCCYLREMRRKEEIEREMKKMH